MWTQFGHKSARAAEIPPLPPMWIRRDETLDLRDMFALVLGHKADEFH
jgi:hypothetical protein